MALNFFKKKNDKRKVTPLDIAAARYLENMQEYVAYHKSLMIYSTANDENQTTKYMIEYNNAINEIVNYLITTFPTSILESQNAVEIKVSDMKEHLSENTFNMLRVPMYPSIIDVKRGYYDAHFHTKGNHIDEAEKVHMLPGLSLPLKSEKINRLFQGLTVNEAYALLMQMNLLPADNDFEKVIINYEKRTNIYHNFLRSVIYNLLTKANSETDIKRAQLFAASFDITFNFEPFIALFKEEQALKLSKTNPNC